MKTLSIRISEEEKQLLEDYCGKNDLTMSQVIRKLIKELLTNNAKEETGLDNTSV
jgi:antitoxin component of RelBE/YafQ-DinJ toxin-antitoxin module